MKKLVNVLLYSLLLAVVTAGMAGIRYFIVQEEERIELEAEKRLAAEREAAEDDSRNSSSQSENIRTVLVKKLPVYKNEKIVKIKTDSDTEILSYGDEILMLGESGQYAKIQTKTGTTGFVWSDCIGIPLDQDKQTDAQLKVVVIDVKAPEQEQEIQKEGPWQDAFAWSLKTAKKLEKKLEERGYTAVMVKRAEEDTVSPAKSAELANQIKADAVIHICIGSSEESTASGAAAFCCSGNSSNPAAKYYADSRKLGKYILRYYTKATGFENAGIMENDEYPGIKKSKRPMVLFRMGDLSNEKENRKMSKPKFQEKTARGIADGMDAYFSNK